MFGDVYHKTYYTSIFHTADKNCFIFQDLNTAVDVVSYLGENKYIEDISLVGEVLQTIYNQLDKSNPLYCTIHTNYRSDEYSPSG